MVSAKQLSILFTSTYFYPYLSGLTEYPLTIARYFAKKHQVSVLTFRNSKKLAKKEKLNSITIDRASVHIRVFKGLWNFFYPFMAFKQVKKADVIFINLPSFEGFWPALWGKILNKKVYCIYHCELAFGRNLLAKTAAFIGNLSGLVSCLMADKVITYTKDYAVHSGFLKPVLGKTAYVLPPVKVFSADKNYLKKLKQKTDKCGSVIGFAGRVAREKGLEYLFEALVKLKNKYPHIMLLVAGPYGDKVVGESTYYQKIKRIVSRKKLKVEFLGSLSKEKLFAFYKTIDLLVLPSINKTEAFGMVQAEAMLSGKPVVASDLPGVRMPVKLTAMGLSAEVGNTDDLAEKIVRIIANPAQFQEPDTVSKVFTINNTFKFYESLL